MSLNLPEYWASIREREAELRIEYPKAVPLVLLRSPEKFIEGGQIVFATHENAARCLENSTHRIASEAEVAGWTSQDSLRAREIKARTQRMFGEDPIYVRARPRQ